MEHLNKQTFKEKVFDYDKNTDWAFNGELPAIVDFYADWCGPCKMLSPILEEISKEYDGKINVYKVNTEEEPELSSLFGITSIPSVLFIPKEEKPQMMVGALPKKAFEEKVKDVLKIS